MNTDFILLVYHIMLQKHWFWKLDASDSQTGCFALYYLCLKRSCLVFHCMGALNIPLSCLVGCSLVCEIIGIATILSKMTTKCPFWCTKNLNCNNPNLEGRWWTTEHSRGWNRWPIFDSFGRAFISFMSSILIWNIDKGFWLPLLTGMVKLLWITSIDCASIEMSATSV